MACCARLNKNGRYKKKKKKTRPLGAKNTMQPLKAGGVVCAVVACFLVALQTRLVGLYTTQGTPRYLQQSAPYVQDVQGIDPVLLEYQSRRMQMMYRPGARGLVCELDAKIGFANKMMHIASCVALSVVTDRVFFLDWDEYVPSVFLHAYSMAIYGEDLWSRSSYESLFETFFSDVATAGHDLEPRAPYNTYTFLALTEYDKKLENLSHDNVDDVFRARTIYVTGWSLWCVPLFSNPWYKETALAVLGAEKFFPAVLKALFRPIFKPPMPTGCQWLIQYRAHSAYYPTAPVEAFERCAENNGFNRSAGDLNFLISDEQKSVPGFVSWEKGCRTGFYCDVQAIHQMYLASTCRYAVLTYKSTYGQVAVAIGNISHVWIVDVDGSCARKNGTLPDRLV